jgi:hypothetical protein
MKKTLLILFLFPLMLFGQNIEYDDDYTLKGTTVLKWSSKYRQTYYQYGYYLDQINSSACDTGGKPQEELEDAVIAVNQSDSTIVLSISKVGNCSAAFLAEIEIVNDSIIHLITHEYGGRSTCICCFGLDFTIKTEGLHKEIRYVMIDENRKTLIKMDEPALKGRK